MKYYQISRSAEPKIIGRKDGMSQVELIENSKIDKDDRSLDFENHFSRYNKDFWNNQDIVFNLNPPLFSGKLRKGAKITDLMEYGPVYHYLYRIYSEKYINIIKRFSIGDYKTFNFKVEDVNKMFHLLFIRSVTLNEIFYDKSIVVTGHKIVNNIKYHNIKTSQEYIEFNKNFPTGGFKKLTISKKYYGRDIIQTEVNSLPFYSEKLIDFLLDCGITGLEIKYKNSIQLEFI